MTEPDFQAPRADGENKPTQTSFVNRRSAVITITALAFAAFALGSTEFVVVGLLPEISSTLGVTVNAAGLLISLYALTIFIATPFVAAATSHVAPSRLLFMIMAVFSACNIVAGIATSYGVLVAARIVMAISHGAFFGVAATVAASLVEEKRAGRAIATIMTGVTVAMVVGVPAGSWAGQFLSWRLPFLLIGAMGILSLVLLAFALPRDAQKPTKVPILEQLSQLATVRFARLYGMAALAVAATLVFFTFLSPFLTTVTGVGEATVGIALFVFGVATVLGNSIGGRLTDGLGWRTALTIEIIGLILSLLMVPLVAHYPYLMLFTIGLIGFFGFAVPSVMQAGIVETAKREAPSAVNTASGMTVAAINLGITAGSSIAGGLLEGPGLISTPIAGAILGLLALVLVRTWSPRSLW